VGVDEQLLSINHLNLIMENRFMKLKSELMMTPFLNFFLIIIIIVNKSWSKS